jgi:hypothetical protein
MSDSSDADARPGVIPIGDPDASGPRQKRTSFPLYCEAKNIPGDCHQK